MTLIITIPLALATSGALTYFMQEKNPDTRFSMFLLLSFVTTVMYTLMMGIFK